MNTSILTISNISIKQDAHGRFCLNDLHKASGGESRHKPDNWKRSQQAIDLISLLESENCNLKPIDVINGGIQRGTYVVKELVYAYAMWISAKFHLTVIRAYDAMVNQKPYGLKEKVYPEMVAKPHFITRNMERHLKHHVDILVRQSNLTPNKIWRDFCAYFLIDSWQNLPMQNYVAACRYFEIEPIYTPECNNNFVYIDLSRFESVQNESTRLKQLVRDYESNQNDMFRPQEAIEILKKLGYTVSTGMDDAIKQMARLEYSDFIRLINESNEYGYYMVKKEDVVKAANNVYGLIA